MNDQSCCFSIGPIVEVNMAIDQSRRRQWRRRKHHHHHHPSQLLQMQRRHHATCFLRPTSSSASIFCILVPFLALLSASSCCAFSFSSSATPTTSKTLAISRCANTIRDSQPFHRLSSLSSSSSSQRTLHHNMSAVADVPQSSSSTPMSSSSTSSSNSFQRRMEKLVRRNNSENINNIISRSRGDERGGEIEDGAGKYSQYGNYYANGSSGGTNNQNNHHNNNNYHNLKTVHTLLEYKQVLDECRQEDSKEGTIVVVRFFATWCKACKAIQPSYHRLASLHPNMIFLEVPVTNENANLHQGLEVPSLPYGHIYHPTSGLVEELKISRKYFHNLVKMVKWYEDGMCHLDEYVNPSSPLQEGVGGGGGESEVGDVTSLTEHHT